MAACPECSARFEETDLKKCPKSKAAMKGPMKEPAPPLLRKKGKDSLRFYPKVPQSEWLEKSDLGEVPLFQSAKLAKVRELLLKWQRETPDEKIIIFCQWRGFLTLVGRILEEEKIGFIYYTASTYQPCHIMYCIANSSKSGSGMSAEGKDRAVRNFEQKPEIKVMISGLTCGSVGLNLAFASRVISV